jgi:hypothetical protein
MVDSDHSILPSVSIKLPVFLLAARKKPPIISLQHFCMPLYFYNMDIFQSYCTPEYCKP